MSTLTSRRQGKDIFVSLITGENTYDVLLAVAEFVFQNDGRSGIHKFKLVSRRCWEAGSAFVGRKGITVKMIPEVYEVLTNKITSKLKGLVTKVEFVPGPIAEFIDRSGWSQWVDSRHDFPHISNTTGQDLIFRGSTDFAKNFPNPNMDDVLELMFQELEGIRHITLGPPMDWKKSGSLRRLHLKTVVPPFSMGSESGLKALMRGLMLLPNRVDTICFHQKHPFRLHSFGASGSLVEIKGIRDLSIYCGEGLSLKGVPKVELNEMAAIIGKFSHLEHLTIKILSAGRAPIARNSWFTGPSKFSNVIGDGSWSALSSVYLSGLTASSTEIVDFIRRHRQTLKALGFGGVYITEGSWRDIFIAIQEIHLEDDVPLCRIVVNGGLLRYLSRDWEWKKLSLHKLGGFIVDVDSGWPFGEEKPYIRRDGKDWADFIDADLGDSDEDEEEEESDDDEEESEDDESSGMDVDSADVGGQGVDSSASNDRGSGPDTSGGGKDGNGLDEEDHKWDDWEERNTVFEIVLRRDGYAVQRVGGNDSLRINHERFL